MAAKTQGGPSQKWCSKDSWTAEAYSSTAGVHPDHLAATLRHVWSHTPTSERIVQDISRLSTTIEQIIAHKGCLVPDLVIHASKKGCSRTRRTGGSRLGPEVSAVAQKRVEELRAQAKSLSGGSE